MIELNGKHNTARVFTDNVEQSAVTQIEQSPKAAGADRIFLPGDMEWERYSDAVSQGLVLPADVESNARELAGWLGLDFNSCLVK